MYVQINSHAVLIKSAPEYVKTIDGDNNNILN